jgi:3-deoxy-D-manno-octulosonic-acid transferase
MPYLLNAIYLLTLIVLSPWLAYKALTTGKYRRGLWTKLTGRVDMSAAKSAAFTVWFHGVSVGEIHLLRTVVAAYRRRFPNHQCVISTTTDTGLSEACKAFPDCSVIIWPFDFTWAVKTALKRVKPDLVVLAEGEVWPNFVAAANRRGVRLALVNGRMSPRSAGRYAKLGWLARRVFTRLDVCAVQTEEYAAAFRHAGAKNVIITGNVKYDGACGDRGNPRTTRLRQLFGIRPGEIVWVAGSTQDPEEAIVVRIYLKALRAQPNLRLILVPRQQERFGPAAELLEKSGLPYVRRSELTATIGATIAAPIILLDTFGELGAVWGLADIAFVGGSLDGRRGGQNMIEPAAYGAAVTFGPFTWNFKDTVDRLLHNNAALCVADAAGLEMQTIRLLADNGLRAALGAAARQFVAAQQGGTEGTVQALTNLVHEHAQQRAA